MPDCPEHLFWSPQIRAAEDPARLARGRWWSGAWSGAACGTSVSLAAQVV